MPTLALRRYVRELGWNLNAVVPHTYIPRLLTLLGFQDEEFSRLLGRSQAWGGGGVEA